MPCDIATGRTEACKESVGGLRNIYIANFVAGLHADVLLENLDSDEQITALDN